MRCRAALIKIDALRTGELKPAEQGEVHEHLRTCRSCDESLGDVERLARAVKALAPAVPRSLRESNAIADGLDRVTETQPAVWVAFSDRGIRMIHPSGPEEEFRTRYARRHGRSLTRRSLPKTLRDQVVAALAGGGTARPAVDFGEIGKLEEEVLKALLRVPHGEVRSYSWLAQEIGRPKAVRAVANVVARNFVPFLVPCHRIVPAQGGVGRYGFGGDAKRALLAREGVDVERLERLAREQIRFIGSRTTRVACVPTCRDARRIRDKNRVVFHGVREAVKGGFRPCRRCRPFAA
jgi:O-6-methylguanine DNA methyltransferase